MAKDKNYKKVIDDFHKQMEKYSGMEFPDGPEFEEWIDLLENNLRKASHEALKKQPESLQKQGFAEAYFVGLARFTCRLLNKMERQGMFAKGKDGYGFYVKVLMPICNEIVVKEMDEEERAKKVTDAIVGDILNFDLSIDDILKKHFPGREDEWPEIRQALEEGRTIAKEQKTIK